MYLKVHLSSSLTVEWTKPLRDLWLQNSDKFKPLASRVHASDCWIHTRAVHGAGSHGWCVAVQTSKKWANWSAPFRISRWTDWGREEHVRFLFSDSVVFTVVFFWFCWSSCHLCWIKNCAMCRWTDMMSFSRQRWLMWRSGGKTLPKCIQMPEMLKPSGPWEVPRHPFFFLGERLALQIFCCQEQLARTVPRHVLDCHRCRNQFDPFWCDPSSAKSWAHPSCRTKPSSSVPRAQNLNIGLVLWQSKDPVLQGDLGVNSRMLRHLYTVFRHILWNT